MTPPAAEAPATHPLDVVFVLPDRSPAPVTFARVTLTDAEGNTLVEEASGPGGRTFVGVRPGVYALTVAAEGLRHVPEELDLTDERELRHENGRTAYFHRITLWPDDWIPVIVRTSDGRPFRALTDDLELEPRRFFLNAFALEVSPYPIDPAGPVPPAENETATFRTPSGSYSVEISAGVAGSLQLRQAPPLWVGLWLHGTFHESKQLRAGDTEVVFEVDQDDLDARFGTVRLRLVDRDTELPVREALATLKANTSSHRRHDLQDLAPDEEGQLVFRRVVPGRHELSIGREGHAVQRQVELAPGEELDLGDVPIGAGPGIRLRVVDAEGRGLRAWLEIAPYEVGDEGRWEDDLYHPNLHRQTDEEEGYLLPVPDRLSVVRARPIGRSGSGHDPRGYYGGTPEVGTANVLVDPDDPPLELVLEERPRVRVHFDTLTPWVREHRLTVHDELNVIVDRIGDRTPEALRLELLTGRYTVRRWDGETELDSVSVVIDESTERVIAP